LAAKCSLSFAFDPVPSVPRFAAVDHPPQVRTVAELIGDGQQEGVVENPLLAA
jgi:hypothetical protein